MKSIKVRDIMVPLSEYGTVYEDDTLYDVVNALQRAMNHNSKNRFHHKSVLVYNKNREIVGKVSPLDIMRALEPKYSQLGHTDPLSTIGLSRFGLSPEFIKSLITQYSLWDEPLKKLVNKAADLKVCQFMYTPLEGEFVTVDASLAEAIHQLVLGHHQSLLVMNGDKIAGILRLVDIFKLVCDQFSLKHPDEQHGGRSFSE